MRADKRYQQQYSLEIHISISSNIARLDIWVSNSHDDLHLLYIGYILLLDAPSTLAVDNSNKSFCRYL